MKLTKKILVSSCSCLLLLVSSAALAKNITVATFTLDTLQVDSAVNIMKPIYKRIGYDMSIIRFPGKRSLVEANNGTTQAELFRVKSIEDEYKNLIRMPYPIGKLKVVALTLSQNGVINNKSDMLNKRVGILRGVEVFDSITQGMQREVVNNIDSLFEILFRGRVGLILFSDMDIRQYINNNDLSNKVNIGGQPILEVPLFHFVHKDSKELIEKLTKEMKQMKDSGELDQLIESSE